MRTVSNKVHINQLVGKYMVRMGRMNQLIQYAYSDNDSTVINVVIDLYSIKNSILGVDFEANGYDLCSAVLDLVVHYKNYFYGIGVRPNFIIIDANNKPIRSLKINPIYNSTYTLKMASNNYAGVKANIDLLEQICQYLPISFYRTDDEASVVIKYLLGDGKSIPSMVISRDPYISLLFDTDLEFTWLYPSKYQGNDVSWIADKRNYRVAALNKIYGLIDKKMPYIYRIPLSMIYAATRFPARSLPSILQYRTLACKIDANDTVWDINALDKIAPGSAARLLTLDIGLQLESYVLSTESKLIATPVPKMCDIGALKLINNDLFAGTLQLDELLK